MGEENKFQEEWDTYKAGNGFGCVAVIALVLTIIIFRNYEVFNTYAPYVLFSVFVAFGIFSLFKGAGWKCPNCKKTFDPQRGIAVFGNEHCVNCDLPIYFGSNYFLEYWGNERGKEQVDKVKEQGGI